VSSVAKRSGHAGLAALVLALAAITFYVNLSARPVETDEALYAAVARHALRTGEWLHLEHEGQAFLNKPPLHFWLTAASMRLLGTGELGTRFVSATLALATIVLIYLAGRRMFGPRAALAAAFVAATTLQLVWLGRQGKMDVILGFWMTLAVVAFLLGVDAHGRHPAWLALAFASMTIAVLLKGPIGVILPGSAALFHLIAVRRWRAVREAPALAIGALCLIGVAAAYYLALGPEFNHYFFVVENVERLTEPSEPLAFYAYSLPWLFFPWSLAIPCAALALWRSRRVGPGTYDLSVGLWLAAFLLAVHVPSYKERDFLVYVIPPFALLTGRAAEWLLSAPEDVVVVRWARGTLVALSLTLAAAVLYGPALLVRRRPEVSLPLPSVTTVILIAAALTGLYVALTRGLRAVVAVTCGLAVAVTLLTVFGLQRALGRANHVRAIADDIRARVATAPLLVSPTEGTTELLYYLDRPAPTRYVPSGPEASRLLATRAGYALLTREAYDGLQPARVSAAPGEPLAEYRHRRWRYVLVRTGAPL
jgi:4-amino-4-deoxy-L-arabinose transferase-like glycosyltransferase